MNFDACNTTVTLKIICELSQKIYNSVSPSRMCMKRQHEIGSEIRQFNEQVQYVSLRPRGYFNQKILWCGVGFIPLCICLWRSRLRVIYAFKNILDDITNSWFRTEAHELLFDIVWNSTNYLANCWASHRLTLDSKKLRLGSWSLYHRDHFSHCWRGSYLWKY